MHPGPVEFSVGEVAAIAGVTVRALHHYDEVGLLVPSGRTRAGHRRYTAADLDRLREVLLYRELGFGLDEIATMLAGSGGGDASVDEHLRRQHDLLNQRIGHLRTLVIAIEKILEAGRMGIDLTPRERVEIFGGFDPAAHTEEVERRWGTTDAYAESARRTAGYRADHWRRITAEADELTRRWVAALDAGVPAEEAGDLAEEHRAQLTRHFYPCTYEIQVGLADLYLSDERFTAYYDRHRVGLAAYVHDAILANAIDRS